jgi:hypothetical protein
MSVPSGPNEFPWTGGAASDLLCQASAVLAREVQRLLLSSSGMTSHPSAVAPRGTPDVSAAPTELGNRVCPVTGATVPLPRDDKNCLRQQAHELVAGILAAFGQTYGNTHAPSDVGPIPGDVSTFAGRKCPVTKAAVPVGGFGLDNLRKQAHGFIETLLITFNDTTGEKGLPTEDKVPLMRCESPVQAGSQARAILTVGNEEAIPANVALYCTNFVADSGYEIPSLRVSVSPRQATIAANGEATFQITIVVSQQTPTGIYSALVQAMGAKYVKAVLSLEVL